MVKPGGSLSFVVGNLSTAAAIGGATTGASFAAASLSGRPIRGEPGGSAGLAAATGAAAGAAAAAGAGAGAAAGAGAGAAAGVSAAGGLAGCWARAPAVNIPIKAPASSRLRGADEQIIMTFSLAETLILAQAGPMPARVTFPAALSNIYPSMRNRKHSCSEMRQQDDPAGKTAGRERAGEEASVVCAG